MLAFGQQTARKGERTDRWLGLAHPTIKYNPSLLYENSFCLGKQGECLGSRRRDKGCKSPEMVCKTRIVFSDEYSAMDIPNARNSKRDTKPILYRKVSVRYFTSFYPLNPDSLRVAELFYSLKKMLPSIEGSYSNKAS